MKRQIIKINDEQCNGCGLCVSACHEGAIAMINGKAKLIRDDYCDGLGNCLPVCPTGAITFEEREATEFDEKAVKENMEKNKMIQSEKNAEKKLECGCPGSNAKAIHREEVKTEESLEFQKSASQLRQWPVQIKLVPVNAPYFNNANLLIAADCAAYAYANFHNDFIKNHIAIIGCPKLDMTDYSEKLSRIIKENNIKSIKIVRMEVPCCGGIEFAAKDALQKSGKFIPWQVYTISTDGEILD